MGGLRQEELREAGLGVEHRGWGLSLRVACGVPDTEILRPELEG